MILKTKLLGHVYEFKSVKDALAKANEEKSGDRLAGIAAENAEERVAAKVVVANLTLADLRANPAVPYEEDEVTRIIQDDVNEKIYEEIRNWTVAELREWLLDEKKRRRRHPPGEPRPDGGDDRRRGQADEQSGSHLRGQKNPRHRPLQHHHRSARHLLLPSAAQPHHR